MPIEIKNIPPSSFKYEWLTVDDLLARYDERLYKKLRSEVMKYPEDIGITIDLDVNNLIVYKTTYEACSEFLKVFKTIREL